MGSIYFETPCNKLQQVLCEAPWLFGNHGRLGRLLHPCFLLQGAQLWDMLLGLRVNFSLAFDEW